MAVTYKKLFNMLIEKDMTTTQLQQKAGFSANIVPRMKRNGYISLDTIESICRALECGVDDILEFQPDSQKEETR
ncbi:MAG TPA: helix-turn-helix transcriptional regulator [Ruminococcus sp.]|nr:helix-turn-helix transcriptional regulator [Ruminococcus sp.]